MPTISSIFIDKIALCYDMGDDLDGFISMLRDACDDKNSNIRRAYPPHRIKGYRYSFVLPISERGDKFCLISAGSIRPNARSLRIEWSPHNVGEEGTKIIFDRLNELLLDDHFNTFKSEALVTRIDISFDVYPIRVDSLVFDAENYQITTFYKTNKVQTETINLGSSRSYLHFVVYDKNIEARRHRRPAPPEQTTRIEAQVRPNIPLEYLHTISNPFVRLNICKSVNPNRLLNNYILNLFLDSVRHRGFTAAVKLLPSHRARYNMRQLFKHKFSAKWYNGNVLWDGWPSALRNALWPGYRFPKCRIRNR